MNKNTLILLVVTLGLGAAAWFVTRQEAAPTLEGIVVSGFATEEQLLAEKSKGMMEAPKPIDHSIDGIEITRAGVTVRLAKDGAGDEMSWRLTAPMEASAVKYQVEKMVAVFKTDTRSVHAKKVKDAAALKRFDLEPERRIHVKLTTGGAPYQAVDWIIGGVQDAESQTLEGSAKDTWIMKAGDESTVYRIAGKDLREPFEVELAELRDKKVFAGAKAGDVVSLEITDPDGQKLALTGDRKETPAEEEGKPPKIETAWTVTAPAGIEADKSVDSTARAVANLRAKEFVAKADGPAGGLGDKTWKVRAKTHDGTELAIDIAAGEDDEVWAQVPGSEELIQLDKWNANNLRKGVANVRNRKLFDVEEGAVTRLQFAAEAGSVVIDKRPDGSWAFAQPPTQAAADPSSILRSIVGATATRYARAGEQASAEAALSAADFKFVLGVGAQTWTVDVGAKLADGEGDLKDKRWARVTGLGQPPGAPMLLADYIATRFKKSFDDLRSKKPFLFTAGDVSRLEVAWADGTTVVALERPPSGGDLLPAAIPEGKAAKAATVKTLAGTLPNMRAKAFASGKTAAEAGLIAGVAHKVTAFLADGTEHRLLISEQKEGEDPYAMAETGPLANAVFIMNKYQADNLLKQPEELVE